MHQLVSRNSDTLFCYLPLKTNRWKGSVIFMEIGNIKLGEALDVGWLPTYGTPSSKVRSSKLSFGSFCDSRVATLLFHQYPLLWQMYFTSCWLSNMTDGSSVTSCFSDPAVHTCLHYSWQPRARLSAAAELLQLPTVANQAELKNRTTPTATSISLHRQRNVNVSGTDRSISLHRQECQRQRYRPQH